MNNLPAPFNQFSKREIMHFASTLVDRQQPPAQELCTDDIDKQIEQLVRKKQMLEEQKVTPAHDINAYIQVNMPTPDRDFPEKVDYFLECFQKTGEAAIVVGLAGMTLFMLLAFLGFFIFRLSGGY